MPFAPLWLALLPALVCGQQYQLLQEYSGSAFFDRWQFYDNCTLSHALDTSFVR